MTELEKKAIDVIRNHSHKLVDNFTQEDLENREISIFLAGYHEGNKANEWHKDLPTEDVELAIIEVEDCGYLLCYYLKGIWYDKGSNAVCKDWITRNIKRWKEIVPQDIEEE